MGKSVPECWLSVNGGVSNESIRVDALQVCLDVTGSSLDVCCNVSPDTWSGDKRLTRSIGVGDKVDDFVPDVVGQNVVVLAHQRLTRPTGISKTYLVEGVDRIRVLVEQIRSPRGGRPVDRSVQRERDIEPRNER